MQTFRSILIKIVAQDVSLRHHDLRKLLAPAIFAVRLRSLSQYGDFVFSWLGIPLTFAATKKSVGNDSNPRGI